MDYLFGWLARHVLTLLTALFGVAAALAALAGSAAGAVLGIAAVAVTAAIQIGQAEASHRRSRRATRRLAAAIRAILDPPLRTARHEVYLDQHWLGAETIRELADGANTDMANAPQGHIQRWAAISESLEERRAAVAAALAGEQADLTSDARRLVAEILSGLVVGSRSAAEMARHFEEEVDRISRFEAEPLRQSEATRPLESPRKRSYADFRASLQAALKGQAVLETVARK